MVSMSAKDANSVATHFGRQMRKERVARGWSLREFSARTGIDFTTLSRIENGRRPPNEKTAIACDRVFPERKGWFREWLNESQHWPEIPATFKSWSDYEDASPSLRDWSPSIVTGLLQTEEYAGALLATLPRITSDAVAARSASRMERQQRVLRRENPPTCRFIVDQLSLYRTVVSPAVMAAQLRHLLEVAEMPAMTIQVLPAIEHPANASGFLLADGAAWVEHATSGYVFTDMDTRSSLDLRFDTLREECFRVSESLRLIERLESTWRTGVSPLTQTPPEATALKSPRPSL
jgi:transcriptional regulator with XRE-family HTH domain